MSHAEVSFAVVAQALDFSVVSRSWQLILAGSQLTLILFGASLALGTVLGLLLALMRLSPIAPLRWLSASFVWVSRGIPTLITLFFAFYVLPLIGIRLPAVYAGILGLGVDAAAYKAEIIRSGIMSVDRGQYEAADALGMKKSHYMRRIIIPQGIRIMVPPYMSNSMTLLKATSLASVITIQEMTGIANRLIASTFRPIEILTTVALMYLAINTVLVLLQETFERRFALKL